MAPSIPPCTCFGRVVVLATFSTTLFHGHHLVRCVHPPRSLQYHCSQMLVKGYGLDHRICRLAASDALPPHDEWVRSFQLSSAKTRRPFSAIDMSPLLAQSFPRGELSHVYIATNQNRCRVGVCSELRRRISVCAESVGMTSSSLCVVGIRQEIFVWTCRPFTMTFTAF